MNPLINVDTFVLIACFIYPWELFPPHIPIADKMKDRDHITALMHIATNCAKSNEALCLLTLRTLREYIETPYLGEIECGSEEDMARRVCPYFHTFLSVQSTPVISKYKGPVYSFDITVFSL